MEQEFVCRTPVLLMIFRRTEITRKTFESIRRAKPSKLFIAADGPRANRPDDQEECEKCREIVNLVDWDCEVHTKFSDVNLGVGRGTASAITWFFENVDEGIIFEDDAVASMSFFRFCQELLEKYRDDARVMAISGSHPAWCADFEESYCFIRQPIWWGWATWKRVWEKYDYEMKLWPEVRRRKLLKNILTPEQYNLYEFNFQNTHDGIEDTSDYQFYFCMLCNNGLNIVPKVNMIRNIGFDANAAHAGQSMFNKTYFNLEEEMEFPLTHPSMMIPLEMPYNLNSMIPITDQRQDFQQRNEKFLQLLRAGRAAEALAYFKDALKNPMPFQPIYVYYAAHAYLGVGDYDHAAELTEDLIRMNFLPPEALDPLRNHPLIRIRLERN